jgi:serine/threonine protein kinase
MADLPSEARDSSADRTHGIMEWPRIPGYEIEGRIGAGGMAVVFRAHDERLRRPVALKVITPDVPGSSRLTGVSVAADGTIYAVGYTCPAHCGTIFEIDRPLILRRRDGGVVLADVLGHCWVDTPHRGQRRRGRDYLRGRVRMRG